MPTRPSTPLPDRLGQTLAAVEGHQTQLAELVFEGHIVRRLKDLHPLFERPPKEGHGAPHDASLKTLPILRPIRGARRRWAADGLSPLLSGRRSRRNPSVHRVDDLRRAAIGEDGPGSPVASQLRVLEVRMLLLDILRRGIGRQHVRLGEHLRTLQWCQRVIEPDPLEVGVSPRESRQ